MESEYELLKRYAQGYSDTETMIDVAYKFYHLGKMLDSLDDRVKQQYRLSLPFLYEAIVDGMEFEGASEVLVDIHDATIQRTTGGAEELLPALFCVVNILGNDKDDILHKDSVCIEKHPQLDEEHYVGFLADVAKKSRDTYFRCRCMDPTILECFITFAFLAGQGMPVTEAIRKRHQTVQQYVSYIRVDSDFDQGYICLN